MLSSLGCSASSRAPNVVAHADAGQADRAQVPAEAPAADPSSNRLAADGGGSNALHEAAVAQTCRGTHVLPAYVADPKLCVYVFAEGLGAARQLAFARNGDLFVNNGEVTVLWDADGDGYSGPDERKRFAQAPGLNHGLSFSPDGKQLYASSDSTVYRWMHARGQRSASGPAQAVISGIPQGGHSSRSLAFDSQGRLYVAVGSASNVDSEPADIELRSQIRRFQLPNTLPEGGLPYASGEPIATGMRNEAGIFIDAQDRLWGVENGRDNLRDSDLGGDIHNDNPGEEINLVDGRGARFYGYPSCFSEHTLPAGKGPGSQWADESVVSALRKSDDFCADPERVHPPAYSMPAHWAPLGIIQYAGDALPYAGDLIVSAHGSWNRSPATGRVIARAKLQADSVSDLQVIVGQKNDKGELIQGRWDVRPVDVREAADGAIYVSDDNGGRILKIGYRR